jgi:MarR family 2-MHQ and catechol resistance regulon transcriptional repressor
MPTKYKGKENDVRVLNTFIKMMRASESINSRLNQNLLCNELTISQFGIMEALLHIGPQNQRELGAKLLKSGGNITMVIDNLVKRGWVTREKDPNDRRAVIISLTTEGEEHIKKYFPLHLKKIVEEFSVLTPEETEELGRICKKIGLKA